MSVFAALGLSDSASLEEVKLAFRQRAQELHPDHGGDPMEFEALQAIYNEAKQEVLSRKCPTCHGTGKVQHSVGFSSIDMPCPTCR
jgi:DnaJ-class molecular chaperone